MTSYWRSILLTARSALTNHAWARANTPPCASAVRSVARQHPPLTADSGAGEDGMQDVTDIDNALLA